LLKRLGEQSNELDSSTNALGDWYATLVYVGRIQLVLCTSANSLLSVVVEARQARARIAESLRNGLETLLFDIGISESQVRAELEEMRDYQFGPTASRNILGTMNDFMQNIYYRINEQPEVTLRQINLDLSGTPCKGPRGYSFPSERARMLMENWHRECDSTMH
jgi:hypothetical protein